MAPLVELCNEAVGTTAPEFADRTRRGLVAFGRAGMDAGLEELGRAGMDVGLGVMERPGMDVGFGGLERVERVAELERHGWERLGWLGISVGFGKPGVDVGRKRRGSEEAGVRVEVCQTRKDSEEAGVRVEVCQTRKDSEEAGVS